ncbi:MAG: M50 family metallopeptidase [Clostridiales bacterium]|nr:M50 family metallopeptidase [Clostridiales bacterium]MCD7856826.1 M50 family metallopeptidase [Clostridiales bacterium]
MLYIILAILMFGLLIAVHEFGHFSVAKLCGVRVNEFSIGMGPLLLHKQGKETEYSLRLLPIGGFCAMEGEDETSDDPRAFGNAPGWKRFLILIAGSGFNFLLGLLIMLCVYSTVQSYVTPQISGFMEGNPCDSEEYLQEGDIIYSINGSRVLVYSDVTILFSLNSGDTMEMTVLRDGEKIHFDALPLTLREYTVDGETVTKYGLYFSTAEASPLDRIQLGFASTVDCVRQVWWSLKMLIGGQAGFSDLSGPIGIVDSMAQVGEASASTADALLNLLYFAGFIAINLAVMNLLPIPALDGGRVFFLLVNGVLTLVIHRQIPAKYEGIVHAVGMVLLLALMLAVAVQDVWRIVAQ